jgi:orotate phosphoribosyltransferase
MDKPFTWVSGIQSPIYCDNRIINSKVDVRDAVISEFTNIILKNYLPEIDVIAGVATGGIPYGVLIADRLKLPFIYVREKRKEYGLKKIIEGAYSEHDRVILIEDHISTGMSSIKAVQGLREAGLNLTSLMSIMTYGFRDAEAAFRSENIHHESICDLDIILQVAQEESILSEQDAKQILKFRESPTTWRNM